MGKIHGGRLLARALHNEGVDTVFTLHGGHIVSILDGCVQEGIRVVDVRHEETAAHAAEAYSRLTGRLGVAVVTAGPGVTNAITGIMNAHMSHTPMLVIGGRHLIRQEQTGGLQELDHPPIVTPITKWVGTVWQTERIADYVAIAARHAFSGRGGPVFMDIPLDVQADMVDEDTALPAWYRRSTPSGADGGDIDRVAAALGIADRPVIFAGNGFGRGDTSALVDLAELLDAPAFTNGGARGAFPHDHPLLGVRTRSLAFAGADLVLALGVDWDFRTGYGSKINSDAFVIQVDAEPTRLGWNRAAHEAVIAHTGRFVAQLIERHATFAFQGDRPWRSEIQAAEAAKLAAAEEAAADDSVPVMPERFGRDVARFFGPDAIVAVDGGDIVSTTAKWLQTATAGHVLDAGPAGTLGTGPGFALAAAVVHPDKTVGIVFGDGGFGFNGMEYDTFVRHGLGVIGVMGNDGAWSNTKTFHRMFYPERLVATDLGRRPYHDMVTALGGYGELVTAPGDIINALERARASGLPALVNVHLAETIRASSNYST